MTTFPYILTQRGVSVTYGNQTVAVASDEPEYERIVAAIKAGDDYAISEALTSKAERLAKAATSTLGDITVTNGAVYYKGAEVHNAMTGRMLDMLDLGFDLKPMAAFLGNLLKNPSFRAVQDLYSFLEFGGMPITEDGHFLAYKAIANNWFDIYSGKFDNSIGSVVEMPRNMVDENPNQTCSAGLHVCSFEYLPHFSHTNGHVVLVKINPADVVAIPTDYNNTKMRVSRYEVLSEVENYYTDHQDVLRGTGVWDYDSGDEVEVDSDSDSDSDVDDDSDYDDRQDGFIY